MLSGQPESVVKRQPQEFTETKSEQKDEEEKNDS